ncbi:hypothetical protein G3N55_11260 [Dissulfurirhabdus thermomarina]|uniref:Lipoprotein n=1 Tax=Dissulfurirhabdus thermomarina TaxID=1765737 RepID=A0A6N9TY62_DISTH|nr:hypothetical protein [Dissulfurirhabdus thermomarina]NDY43416.1 hypothetical protein [Dissulfurirhabdus thermomarina]NMX23528.1 hypothetical protein [Dissulfurirhabdus thermomarina]
MKFTWIGILSAAVLLCACSVRQGDFTVLSNRLVNTKDFALNDGRRQKTVGRDVQRTILFIPIGGPPTLEEAIDDALDRSGGDVLTDAVVHRNWFCIPFLYAQSEWRVEGTAVRTRRR